MTTISSRLKKILKLSLGKAGYVVHQADELERFIMRDNLAGLLDRAFSARDVIGNMEADFVRYVTASQCVTQSQLFQDLFVLYSLAGKEHGYYVEVGVGDGVTHSNTRLLERSHKWDGLLVEPNFREWAHIRKNRSGSLVQCAASDTSESIIFNRADTSELSYVGVAAPNDQLTRNVVESKVIPSRTLNSILDGSNSPENFDYLSVDVEGHEISVLKGFDLQRWSPKIITIEVNQDQRRAAEIREMLGTRYEQVMGNLSGCDMWFALR